MAKRSLAEKAYYEIHDRLTTGRLGPGTRLVNRKLAEEIGVSVIPVREAIHRLASEGLIEHVPGSGAYVPERSLHDLNELYVLRDALESCAAAEAARHINEDQLAELEETVKRMMGIQQRIAKRASKKATTALWNRWLDCEDQFHHTLVESSRNKLLSKVIREHRAVSSVFDVQREDPSILTLAFAHRTCQDRTKMLQAIRDQDSGRCRQLMSVHIQIGRRIVLEHSRKRQVVVTR